MGLYTFIRQHWQLEVKKCMVRQQVCKEVHCAWLRLLVVHGVKVHITDLLVTRTSSYCPYLYKLCCHQVVCDLYCVIHFKDVLYVLEMKENNTHQHMQ